MANYKSIYTGEEIDAGIAKANTAIQDMSNKVDKIEGKGLSTNDYTTEEKTKLADIDMSSKQDILVSGTNIKTINNTSILGSGNINIEGGGDFIIEITSYPETLDTTKLYRVTQAFVNKGATYEEGVYVAQNGVLTLINDELKNGINVKATYESTPIDLSEFDKSGQYANGATIFTVSELPENVNGVRLKFEAPVNIGYGVRFFSNNDVALEYVGSQRGTHPDVEYYDTIVKLPSTFSYAKIVTTSGNAPIEICQAYRIRRVNSSATPEIGFVNPTMTSEEIQTVINNSSWVLFQKGTYTINATLDLHSNLRLTGIGSGVKLQAAAQNTEIMTIKTKNNIKIENLCFAGTSEQTGGGSATLAQLRNKTGIGAGKGLSVSGTCINIVVNSCYFTNFTHSAIYNKTTYTRTDSNGLACIFTSNCTINNNYIGIFMDNRAEYCITDSCVIRWNKIGVYCLGGNNVFSDCQAETNNCGYYIGQGENGAHGAIVGGSVNHCNGFSICVDGATNGELISGVSVYGNRTTGTGTAITKGVAVIGSAGVVIANCRLRTGLYFEGNTGAIKVSNNEYSTDSYTIYGSGCIDGDTTNVVLTNNTNAKINTTSPEVAFNNYITDNVPVCPSSANGNYALKSVVNDGVVTYFWEAETV